MFGGFRLREFGTDAFGLKTECVAVAASKAGAR
jgi:hypothetical protein